MSNDEKNKIIATFRFGVIADFVTGVKFSYGERERLIQQKISRIYTIPFCDRTQITRSTLLNWIHLYKFEKKLTSCFNLNLCVICIFSSLQKDLQQ